MKGKLLLLLRLFIILTMLPLAGSAPTAAQEPSITDASATVVTIPQHETIADTFRSSPVMFIENVGQFEDTIRFQVRGGLGSVWLADDAIWVYFVERLHAGPWKHLDVQGANMHHNNESRGVHLKLTFPGANPHARLEPFDRLDTKVSYFIGNDPDQWRPDVPVWGGVRYVDLYPGVDLEMTSEARRWRWEIAERSNVQPNIPLRVERAEFLLVDGKYMRLDTSVRDFTLVLPATDFPYDMEALHVARPSAILNPQASTLIEAATSNRSPVTTVSGNTQDLIYSTFLGPDVSFSSGNGIAVDASGAVYVTGSTHEGAGIYSASFVVKLDATASDRDFFYLLGSGRGYAIAIDESGAAYVAGVDWSRSYNCGTWYEPYPCLDAFVAKLNPTGSALEYITFLGDEGKGAGRGDGIAVDGAGHAYVTGSAGSDFPTTPGAFDRTYNGGLYGSDAFVAKLNPTGTDLEYATFLGGSDSDNGSGIAVDGAGHAYVTGRTRSSDFPTTPGGFDTTYGGGDCWGTPCTDAFVTKLNAAGSALLYSTFLGGNSGDSGVGIAVDGTGSAYVTGGTESIDFPTTPGAFDRTYNGSGDAFVTKLNPTGSDLAYATFLGGSRGDGGFGITVDGTGSAYVTGWTRS